MVFDERKNTVVKEADSLENRKPILFDQVKWDMGADLTTYPLKQRYQRQANTHTVKKMKKHENIPKHMTKSQSFVFFESKPLFWILVCKMIGAFVR